MAQFNKIKVGNTEYDVWATQDQMEEAVRNGVQGVTDALEAIPTTAYLAQGTEITQGKRAISEAIIAKGGTASATESFAELAKAVEDIPNFSDMVKLAGIIAGGNYNKNILQGHNENVKYGKTEIVDNLGAFETINIPYCFQNWDLLERVVMPNITEVTSNSVFKGCSALKTLELPNVQVIRGQDFLIGTAIEVINFPNLESASLIIAGFVTTLREFICPKLNYIQYSLLRNNTGLTNVVVGTLTNGALFYEGYHPNIRNITIGQDTNINLDLHLWTATNVIAEGQSGIDELNSNLYNNLLTKLYDHSNDGETRTLRIGWLANVTAENIAYANAKGWTLTT